MQLCEEESQEEHPALVEAQQLLLWTESSRVLRSSSGFSCLSFLWLILHLILVRAVAAPGQQRSWNCDRCPEAPGQHHHSLHDRLHQTAAPVRVPSPGVVSRDRVESEATQIIPDEARESVLQLADMDRLQEDEFREHLQQVWL